MSQNISVTVKILDKEYQISCLEHEKNELLSSASYVDQKMRQIKTSGKTLGTDRIAVLSALNIAHELLKLSHVEQTLAKVDDQLKYIESHVDQVLHSQNS